MKEISEQTFERLNIGLIVLGVFLRLKHFILGRSLWLDELYVALEVVNRSFYELLTLQRLFPQQPASPPLFLVVERLFVCLFGVNEYALRVYPFLVSILSIFLFQFFLKRHFSGYLLTLALGIFILCEPLIYYAAEVKTYSSDVFFALLLFMFFDHISKNKLTFYNILLLGVVAAFSLWFSFASIFVSTSLIIAIFLKAVQTKKRECCVFGGLAAGLLFMSFCVLNKFLFQSMVSSQELIMLWGDGFPGSSGESTILWSLKRWIEIFHHPLALGTPLVMLFVFVIGLKEQFIKNRFWLVALFVPIVLAFVASLLYKYPFKGRMLLFSIPALIIILMQGIEWIVNRFSQKAMKWIMLTVVLLIFWHPVIIAYHNVIHRNDFQQNRKILSFVKGRFLPGDLIVSNNSAQYAIIFYLYNFEQDTIKNNSTEALRFGKFSDTLSIKNNKEVLHYERNDLLFEKNQFSGKVLVSKNDPLWEINADSNLTFLANQRVWLVFSHVKDNTKKFLIDVFNKNAEPTSEVVGSGTSAYLYQF